jgi:two-component sensor histidine kinase
MKDPALVEAIRQIALLNAEIATLRAAALRDLRERVAGLAYADDQLSPGDEGWGWNEACAAVLAEIDRALEP